MPRTARESAEDHREANRIGQIAIPAAIVGIVVMMVVPLPTPLLDLLLVTNIALATLALLASMSTRRVLDFSIFPSYLLIATLFRLALNVSVTRLVLLHGYAGKVIEAFGHFVVGGSVIVGLVIFLILIVIQFIVITNGAGRVAEVAARFTLDAMPGKQMAIDADLNSGLINEAEAKRRRKEIADEADFYGAMDGASKFVKGDAIAAIVIVLINLIGGFAVGILQKHMSFGDAIQRYSLLTVGDGLVAQIPALLISLSAGLIVTRAATENDLGTDLLAPVHAAQARPAARGRRHLPRSRSFPACRRSRSSSSACLLLILATRLPSDEEILDQAAVARARSRTAAALARLARAHRGRHARRAARARDRVRPHRPRRREQGRRPARPRARAAAQARARARHRHPARAHARQPRPPVEHVRDPRARRRGRPRRSAAGPRARARRRQPGLARHPDARARVRAARRAGCRSSSATRPRSRARPSSTARR